MRFLSKYSYWRNPAPHIKKGREKWHTFLSRSLKDRSLLRQEFCTISKSCQKLPSKEGMSPRRVAALLGGERHEDQTPSREFKTMYVHSPLHCPRCGGTTRPHPHIRPLETVYYPHPSTCPQCGDTGPFWDRMRHFIA